MNDVKASRRGSLSSRHGGLFARRHSEESGFTIIELVVSLSLLAIVAAPLAGVFWSAIRTAGSAAHRSDGAAVASREIEAMRAVPYDQVGFYDDQNATVPPNSPAGTTTVSLGPTSPAANPSTQTLPPQIQPVTPDPKAASGYLPDPNPNNANPVVFGGVTYTVARYVVWADATGPSGGPTPTTFVQAYKQLTVIVKWTDQAGSHTVEQDSLLYPGGRGAYGGPGPSVATTTTAPIFAPTAPVLADINPLNVTDTTAQLFWSQPIGGGVVSYYVIEYATDAGFTQNVNVTGHLPGPSFPVPNLVPSTTYYFEVIAYTSSSQSATSMPKSTTTTAGAGSCVLGGLNVSGATSLSTTGTILKNGGSGQMSEDLKLSWVTSGPCPADLYQVHATDPSSANDPSSPYTLIAGGGGTYSGLVSSANQKGWAVGLHTFTVWDASKGTATSVVKTFKVCTSGVGSC
jgi:prepilin-type N-terminal cleavage/methylation domain-containing protein